MRALESSRFKINGAIYVAFGTRSLLDARGQEDRTDCLDGIEAEETGQRFWVERSYIISKGPEWLPKKEETIKI